MHEKLQKRRLRKDQPSDHEKVETTSSIAGENPSLYEGDFEDITNKLENRVSKRLRDTKNSQREILFGIENFACKADNLSNFLLEQWCSISRIDTQGRFSDISISDNDVLNRTRNATLDTR